MTGLITALFLVGPVIAIPLLLRRIAPLGAPRADRVLDIARRIALPTGLLLALSFVVPPGPVAGAFALPFFGVGGVTATAALADAIPAIRTGRALKPGVHHATWAALVFLPVSAGNAVADRLGTQPFGFDPTIILLTAVHFAFAGFVLLSVGSLAYHRRPRRWLEIAMDSVVVGIPVTAIGFFGVPLAAWVGAMLVAAGGLGVGIACAAVAGTSPSRPARGLLRIAGLTLLVSMPLAAIYATGVGLGTTWLTIPAMAATHGTLNVLGFALPASIGWTLDGPAMRDGRS